MVLVLAGLLFMGYGDCGLVLAPTAGYSSSFLHSCVGFQGSLSPFVFSGGDILSRQCCLVALVSALTFPLGPHPCPFHSISLRLRICPLCLPHFLHLFLNIILSPTIAVLRPLRTVLTLMQAYRTSQLCEGYDDLCVRRLVRGVRDISLIASSVLKLPI